MIVSMCAGWGQAKDGIADYSNHLSAELSRAGMDVRRVALRNYAGDRAYYRRACGETSGSDVCHIQFNYPYFNGELPYRNRFADFVRGVKAPVIMTVHEVRIGFEPGMSNFKNHMSRAVFNGTIPIWNAWSDIMHRRIYGAPERIIAHTADHVAAIRQLVSDPDKVLLIPHGVPAIPGTDPELSSSEAKKRLKLDGKRILSIFGFINGRKGYADAVEALAALPSDIVLVIAGGKMNEDRSNTDYYEALLRKISGKKLADRVVVTGYLGERDIAKVMAASDICLAPFESKAASGALGLCIGYHKPIVASDVPVHREINGRVACLELFKTGDPSDMARKISGLFGDRVRMAELSEKARAYGDEFSYANIAKRTAEIYRGAASSFGRNG